MPRNYPRRSAKKPRRPRSPIAHTILRNGCMRVVPWRWQSATARVALGRCRPSGTATRYASRPGRGATSFVDADDVGAVAAAALADELTDDVEQLLGRPPTSFEAFAAREKAVWSPSRQRAE